MTESEAKAKRAMGYKVTADEKDPPKPIFEAIADRIGEKGLKLARFCGYATTSAILASGIYTVVNYNLNQNALTKSKIAIEQAEAKLKTEIMEREMQKAMQAQADEIAKKAVSNIKPDTTFITKPITIIDPDTVYLKKVVKVIEIPANESVKATTIQTLKTSDKGMQAVEIK